MTKNIKTEMTVPIYFEIMKGKKLKIVKIIKDFF